MSPKRRPLRERIFVLGLYLKSSSTLTGLLPLFAPINATHCSSAVASALVPTLLALAVLPSSAAIQFIPDPVDDRTDPADPTFSLASAIIPLNVAIPLILSQVGRAQTPQASRSPYYFVYPR